ncbi:histidine kinase/DNA gyrase B/HSP90-like ATPase [Pseudoduganella lurida]|uniref:histidine kinase n=1 Tax=Pseudoduganella lurida TaxID=1036180 RepID=A0A562RKT2_9BURK|nr:ATP-binding protein [Pseudoduganella lurida]TWI69655.1 histidine kinase/DNA gyrase B/HSP90-like ATPase [Pseudoduganella lurida]
MPDEINHQAQSAETAPATDLSDLLGHVVNSWDNEKRGLARQMHDSLGSSLTALTMHLGLLTAKLPADSKPLHDRAAQMKNLLHTIIENNRQMQHKLWNDKLEFLGIKVAISELVAQFGQQYQITARSSLPDDEPTYPREVGVVLLRVAEQGLSNVAAHSGATEVDVIIDDNEDEIMLTVRDNGRGPAPEAQQSRQFGLRLLRERARLLGGALTLAAHPDGGTVLSVVLPKVPAAAT